MKIDLDVQDLYGEHNYFKYAGMAAAINDVMKPDNYIDAKYLPIEIKDQNFGKKTAWYPLKHIVCLVKSLWHKVHMRVSSDYSQKFSNAASRINDGCNDACKYRAKVADLVGSAALGKTSKLPSREVLEVKQQELNEATERCNRDVEELSCEMESVSQNLKAQIKCVDSHTKELVLLDKELEEAIQQLEQAKAGRGQSLVDNGLQEEADPEQFLADRLVGFDGRVKAVNDLQTYIGKKWPQTKNARKPLIKALFAAIPEAASWGWPVEEWMGNEPDSEKQKKLSSFVSQLKTYNEVLGQLRDFSATCENAQRQIDTMPQLKSDRESLKQAAETEVLNLEDTLAEQAKQAFRNQETLLRIADQQEAVAGLLALQDEGVNVEEDTVEEV